VDGKVFFSSRKGKYRAGQFVKMKFVESLDYDLIGEPVEEE
jgi:hypothetical protein